MDVKYVSALMGVFVEECYRLKRCYPDVPPMHIAKWQIFHGVGPHICTGMRYFMQGDGSYDDLDDNVLFRALPYVGTDADFIWDVAKVRAESYPEIPLHSDPAAADIKAFAEQEHQEFLFQDPYQQLMYQCFQRFKK